MYTFLLNLKKLVETIRNLEKSSINTVQLIHTKLNQEAKSNSDNRLELIKESSDHFELMQTFLRNQIANSRLNLKLVSLETSEEVSASDEIIMISQRKVAALKRHRNVITSSLKEKIESIKCPFGSDLKSSLASHFGGTISASSSLKEIKFPVRSLSPKPLKINTAVMNSEVELKHSKDKLKRVTDPELDFRNFARRQTHVDLYKTNQIDESLNSFFSKKNSTASLVKSKKKPFSRALNKSNRSWVRKELPMKKSNKRANFAGQRLTNLDTETIKSYLEQHLNSRILDLQDNQITDKGASRILEYLINFPNIEELNFSGNLISDDFLQVLYGMVKNGLFIKKVVVQKCGILDCIKSNAEVIEKLRRRSVFVQI